jgi:hypothetical protein
MNKQASSEFHAPRAVLRSSVHARSATSASLVEDELLQQRHCLQPTDLAQHAL